MNSRKKIYEIRRIARLFLHRGWLGKRKIRRKKKGREDLIVATVMQLRRGINRFDTQRCTCIAIFVTYR